MLASRSWDHIIVPVVKFVLQLWAATVLETRRPAHGERARPS
jgi:hypothetical protein